jgi:hypothetical protein
MTDNFKKTFPYCRQYSHEPNDLGVFSFQAYAWEGNEPTFWTDNSDGKCLLLSMNLFLVWRPLLRSLKYISSGVMLPRMRYLCYLRGDLSALKPAINHRYTPQGEKFWQVDYNVCVTFGGTQLRACLQWYENVGIVIITIIFIIFHFFDLFLRALTFLELSQGRLREGPISILPNATF